MIISSCSKDAYCLCLLDQRCYGQHCNYFIFSANVKVQTPGLGSVLEFSV